MKQLEIDIGNTYAKWRLREGPICAEAERGTRGQLFEAVHALQPERVLIASVARVEVEAELRSVLNGLRTGSVIWAESKREQAGVRSGYRDHAQLGVDRWLACVASFARVKAACCVLDFGSALTVDLIDADGQHRGGYIIPGSGLCYGALSGGTGRLAGEYDYVSNEEPGLSTKECIENGIYLMQKAFVKQIVSGLGKVTVICTGGGFRQFAPSLSNYHPVHVPDLVLDGLALVAGGEDCA